MSEISSDVIEAYVRSRSHRPYWPGIAPQIRPATEPEGYRLQQAIYDRLLSEGVKRVGYKIGCTAPESQRPFGLSEPIYAGIFDISRKRSLREALSAPLVKPSIECEVAFRIGRDVEGQTDISEEGLIDFISEAYVASEVVDSRYGSDPSTIGVPTLLTDDFLHAAFVLGEPVSTTSARQFTAPRGRIEIEGKVLNEPVPGTLPPLTALAWLVRKLHQNNGHLRKDDIVLTGSLLKPLSIDKPPLRLAMTIESLGSLSTA